MFHAAELGTLTHVHARFIWIEPHVVDLVWKHVDLTGQLRDPEAVNHIGGEQLERSGRRSLPGAERYVQLIGSREPCIFVVKLPPELMTDGIDIEGRRRH